MQSRNSKKNMKQYVLMSTFQYFKKIDKTTKRSSLKGLLRKKLEGKEKLRPSEEKCEITPLEQKKIIKMPQKFNKNFSCTI